MSLMKRFLIFLVLSMFCTKGFCQYKICGHIMDIYGMPVSNVNVQLGDTYDGASSDSLGYFTFVTYEKGKMFLKFSHINYKSVSVEINLDSSFQGMPMRIQMKEKNNILDEVIVTASAIGYSKNKTVAISKLDVYTNPHSNGDLSFALRTTPGLQNIDDKAGFFVRGGNSDETVVAIDGVTVKNFFTQGISNIAGRARYETGLFKGMNFSTGDIPVEYGNAISGSLELKINDIPDENIFGLGFSPVYATANAGTLLSNKTAYVEGAFTYSNPTLYYPMFLKKGWKFTADNSALDGTLRFQKKIRQNDCITFLSTVSKDNKGISQSLEQLSINNKVRNFYMMNLLSYQYFLDEKTKLEFSSGFSKEKNKLLVDAVDVGTASRDTTDDVMFQLHAKMNTFLGNYRICFGLDYFNQKQKYNANRFNEQVFGSYLSSMMKLYRSLSLKVGFREEYSTYYKKVFFMPRGVLSYNLGEKHSLSLGIGMYSQVGNTFLTYGLQPANYSRSSQYNFTYQFSIHDNYLLRVQLFDKNFKKLPRQNNLSGVPIVVSDGSGYAKGLDVFWKDARTLKNFSYTFSYSFLDTKRDYFYGGHYACPSFAAKHNASCVLKYYIPNITSQLGISYSYRSSMPFLINENNNIKDIPHIHSIDFSYNYLFNIKKIRGVLSLSIPNIFNNNSTLGYQLMNNQGELEKLSSPIKQSFVISLFLNLGFDRRSEIINSLIN